MSTLTKHCQRVNRMNACQSAWDNMSDPTLEEREDDEDECDYADYEGVSGVWS